MSIIKSWQDKAGLEKIIKRFSLDRSVDERIKKIIDDVRLRGDKALLKYTEIFDGVSLKASRIKVSPEEMQKAFRGMDKKLIQAIKAARINIVKFHQQEIKKSWTSRGEDSLLGQNYYSLERAGIYVPGGTAPLLSSLLATAIPAQVAGVKEIVMVSPPGEQGDIHPSLLGAAYLLGIKEVYRVGGPQAIGALAWGTKSIPAVDKIAGAGNRYVISAMRQVFGQVGIGLLPGPSEVAILADKGARASYIAADLKAQEEHQGGLAVLVTTSLKLAEEVRKETKKSALILTRNLSEAVRIINKIAPEHLELMVKNPRRLLKDITTSGTIFLGSYSPTAVGDYVAGPSHILPTGGMARFFSGLSVADFQRRTNIISYNRTQLAKVAGTLGRLTEAEGLKAHENSVRVRLNKELR